MEYTTESSAPCTADQFLKPNILLWSLQAQYYPAPLQANVFIFIHYTDYLQNYHRESMVSVTDDEISQHYCDSRMPVTANRYGKQYGRKWSGQQSKR